MARTATGGKEGPTEQFQPIMRYLHLILLILLVTLCVGFTVQFWLMQSEMQQIRASCLKYPQFSCDAFPEHIVGVFHVLSFALLAAVIFAKKYYWAFGLATTYFMLHVLATYARLSTGFFGGDMCPDGHPCLQAIRRASGFDWTALAVLSFSVVLITTILIMKWRTERFPK